MNTTVLSPIKIGAYALPNRVVMAPLTRMRSPNGVANELMATYGQILNTQGVVNLDSAALMNRYRAHLTYAFEAMIVTLAVGGMMDLEHNLELIRRTAAAVDALDAFSALPL